MNGVVKASLGHCRFHLVLEGTAAITKIFPDRSCRDAQWWPQRSNPKSRGLMAHSIFHISTWLLIVAGLSGCAGKQQSTIDLAALYNRSAAHRGPDRNPVIAIPGILGSRLRDSRSGKIVWGAFDGSAVDISDPRDLRLVALPLGRPGAPPWKVRTTVKAVGVLDRARITVAGIPYQLEVYAALMQTLGVGGYRDEELGTAGAIKYGPGHFTCFQFPYDWRRDISTAAVSLHRFILARAQYVREKRKAAFGVDRPVRFDVVAHSMGGLVLRYYLRYGPTPLPDDGSLPKLTWEGARHIDKAILIGTPNAGSVKSLQNLIQGRRFSFILPKYPAGLLGTFPAIFQLLPRARHNAVVWDGDLSRPIKDLYDPNLWATQEWGMANPNQAEFLKRILPNEKDPERRRIHALALQGHILRRAEQFMAALDKPATPPKHLKIYLVAGDSMKTPRTLSIDSNTGAVTVLKTGEGDGTVLRASALMDERMGGKWQPRVKTPIKFHATLFLPREHIELTRNETFRDNLLYWLLEEPRTARGKPRAGPKIR